MSSLRFQLRDPKMTDQNSLIGVVCPHVLLDSCQRTLPRLYHKKQLWIRIYLEQYVKHNMNWLMEPTFFATIRNRVCDLVIWFVHWLHRKLLRAIGLKQGNAIGYELLIGTHFVYKGIHARNVTMFVTIYIVLMWRWVCHDVSKCRLWKWWSLWYLSLPHVDGLHTFRGNEDSGKGWCQCEINDITSIKF